jgi:hypothetical protein
MAVDVVHEGTVGLGVEIGDRLGSRIIYGDLLKFYYSRYSKGGLP